MARHHSSDSATVSIDESAAVAVAVDGGEGELFVHSLVRDLHSWTVAVAVVVNRLNVIDRLSQSFLWRHRDE